MKFYESIKFVLHNHTSADDANSLNMVGMAPGARTVRKAPLDKTFFSKCSEQITLDELGCQSFLLIFLIQAFLRYSSFGNLKSKREGHNRNAAVH